MKRILLTLVMVGMMANIVYAVEPIGEDVKSLVINSIKGHDRIIDASIHQSGKKVMIILIADYGTSEQYARRMGGNLVRMLKSLARTPHPIIESVRVSMSIMLRSRCRVKQFLLKASRLISIIT